LRSRSAPAPAAAGETLFREACSDGDTGSLVRAYNRTRSISRWRFKDKLVSSHSRVSARCRASYHYDQAIYFETLISRPARRKAAAFINAS
jgi:hypothetical protein